MVDGVHHWRAYSLTSDPGRPDGCIAITPKLVDGGQGLALPRPRRAARRRSSASAASRAPSCCPTRCREQLLFISAGSGITPIMSMLRALDRDGALDDVVHLHSRAHAPTTSSSASELRELRRAPAPATACTSSSPASTGRIDAGRPRRAVPRLARARDVRLRPRRDARRAATSTGSARATPTRLHMERFQPDHRLGDAERGEGGTIRFTDERRRGAQRRRARRSSSPARRPAPTLPFGCRMGICHTCVGRLCSGQVRDLRTGEVSRHARRDGPHLHQRPRGRRRDRTVSRPTEDPTCATTTDDREPAGAAHARADRGARPRVRRDPRRGLRRPRRARPPLHPQHDRAAPPARASLGARRCCWPRATGRPGSPGPPALSLAKILENMEIGHNVMHGQWDWMNDPEINSSTWDWDTASTAEAWKHSHNYVHHTYTNIRGKDQDLGYEIMRIDPHQQWHPVYLAAAVLQRLLMAFFEWGVAAPRPRLRGDPQGREVQGAGQATSSRGSARKARRQIVKDYVAFPALQPARDAGFKTHAGGELHRQHRPQRLVATRSSSAATSPTRPTRSARRRSPTRRAAAGTSASCSARRTSRAARSSTSSAATSATRSSTTSSRTCRARATRRSRRR